MEKSHLLLLLVFCIFLIVPVLADEVCDPVYDADITDTTGSEYHNSWATTPSSVAVGYFSIHQNLTADKKPLTFISSNGMKTDGWGADSVLNMVIQWKDGTNVVYAGTATIRKGALDTGIIYWTTVDIQITYANITYLNTNTGVKTFTGSYVSGDVTTGLEAKGNTIGTYTGDDALYYGWQSDPSAVYGFHSLWTASNFYNALLVQRFDSSPYYIVDLYREGYLFNDTVSNMTIFDNSGNILYSDWGFSLYDSHAEVYNNVAANGIVITVEFYGTGTPIEVYNSTACEGLPGFKSLTFRTMDAFSNALLDAATVNVYDRDSLTWHNSTMGAGDYTFTILVPSGNCIYYEVSRADYASRNFGTLVGPCESKYMPTVDTTYDSYLIPNSTDPANFTYLAVFAYWLDGSIKQPINAATVVLTYTGGSTTVPTGPNGYSVSLVPSNTTIYYTVSKTGYLSATGSIAVTNVSTLIQVQLIPGVTTAPTPTTSAPPTTTPPANMEDAWQQLFEKIGITGMWIFAGVIIMVGAYVGGVVTQGSVIGVMFGGGLGFVISVGIGLISFIWFIAILAIAVALLAWKAAGGLGGSGN
jgi:hypothetical protein